MLVIDVTARVNKVEGPLKRVVDICQKMEKSIDKAANAMNKLATAAAKVQNFAPAAVSAAPGGGGGSGGGGNKTRPSKAPPQASAMDFYKFVNGLNTASGGKMQSQRNTTLARVFNHYQTLASQGDPNAMRAVNTLAPHVAKMNQKKPGLGAIAKQIAMSSRFGIGAGGMQMMPLVGQVVAGLSKLGPYGIAAAAALAAFTSGVVAAVHAVGLISEMAGRMAGNRSSASTQGVVDRFGMFGGAGAFGNLSGISAGFAAQAGINPNTGPFGQNNLGQNYIKGLQYVHGLKTYEQAQRYAQGIGSPELANAWFLSDKQMSYARNSSKFGLSEKETGAGVRAQFAMGQVGKSFENLIMRVFVKFAPMIEKGANTLTVVFDQLSRFLPAITQKLVEGMKWLMELWNKWAGAINKLTGGAAGMPYFDTKGIDSMNLDQVRAQRENTQAVRDSIRAMNGLRETMGGGQRARGAIPGKVSGMRLSDPSYRMGLEGGVL